MKCPLTIEFTKMNGAGNDFIVLDNRWHQFSMSELSWLTKKLCPRRTGIGADGLLALAASEHLDADYRMIYINADGSEGTMCGNGARCLAKFAYEHGFPQNVAHIQTASGVCNVYIQDPSIRIYLDMPQNYEDRSALHLSMPDEINSLHYLCPGTQHLVCLVSDISDLPVERWGRMLRNDPAFLPEGTNVNFVARETDRKNPFLRVRTYEKGVEAETLACGTGAVASVVVARISGLITSDAYDVHMQGGILKVGMEATRVFLEGPAETVYHGSMEWNMHEHKKHYSGGLRS